MKPTHAQAFVASVLLRNFSVNIYTVGVKLPTFSVEGADKEGVVHIWITHDARASFNYKGVDAFVEWANAVKGVGVTTITAEYKRVKRRVIGFEITPRFPLVTSQSFTFGKVKIPCSFIEARERKQKKKEKKKDLFLPSTRTNYWFRNVPVILSRKGNLYIQRPYKIVGRVCGGLTATGGRCMRWRNKGHCKGHE